MSPKRSSQARFPQLVPRRGSSQHESPRHSAQFYIDDSFLLDEAGRFIASALRARDSVLAVATESHHEGLARRLEERGLDIALAARQGRYLALDAAETLSRFMVDDAPEREAFFRVVGGAVEKLKAAAKKKPLRIAAFGEMVALLWSEGKMEAALRLEQLWNELARDHRFDLYCAYPIAGASREEHDEFIRQVCREHSHLAPAESYSGAMQDNERLLNVIFLQHKARALEAEIARREAAEQALAARASEQEKVDESRLLLASIVDSSDDAIASKDLNGIVTSWNNAAERIFGYKAEEMIGRPILLIIPPELQSDEQMILSKLRRGEKIEHFETVRMTKAGERIDVSLTISPVRDESGNVIGAAKIVRDITERKRIENALRLTERLASVGRLSATIAHEINNPLEAVTNLLYLAKRDLSNPGKAQQHLEMADHELSRVAHITRQTLGFYRDTSAPAPVDIGETLDDLLFLYARRLESRQIQVIRQFDGKLEAMAMGGEIRQVFSNLLANSIDAMPDGGKLIVRASSSHAWTGSHVPGVRVSIADTGSGIEPQDKKRLFQPFFTTKKDVGTGLGLWIIRGIVEKHGGQIRLRSKSGAAKSGTVFSVFLSEAGRPAASSSLASPASDPAQGD
jgi:PAS domain S-box-containing protein